MPDEHSTTIREESGQTARSEAENASPPLAATQGATGTPVAFTRSADQVQQLLERIGLREQRDAEAEEVERLLLHKLAHHVPGDDETATDTLEVRHTFLRHRFTQPVMAYERGNRGYGSLDTVLNLVSIAAGVGASLVAALDGPKAVTIVLGVTVAACQTLSQWLKPAQRAARRGRAASELRSEAWDLLQGRDRYRRKDIDHAWDIFCDQVDKVENREEIAEDQESAQSPGSTGAGESANA
jgi:hypothetical protein